jgi:hypothetical protein
MKTKYSFGLAVFLGFAAIGSAQVDLQALVINIRSDPKNSPAIVAMAVVENPRSVSRIVATSVKALPRHTVNIVKAALRVAPKQATSIVRAAILAEPSLAVEITNAATAAVPDQSAAILKVAVAAAPADLKDQIGGTPESASSDDNLGESKGSSGPPPSVSFPSQPVQPDLVSPSS